jgi:hypothetical protein
MRSRWLPIPEAAESLGVSAITLKRHIKAGKVNARKEPSEKGLRWLIEVSNDDAQPKSQNGNRGELITHLTGQVEWYQQQLATRDREVSELHILLQRAQQTPQLLAPVVEYQPEASDPLPAVSLEPSRDTAHTVRTQSKKGFWQRLFKSVLN